MSYKDDKEFVRKNQKVLKETTEWKYRGRIYLLEKGREEELKQIIKENVDGKRRKL